MGWTGANTRVLSLEINYGVYWQSSGMVLNGQQIIGIRLIDYNRDIRIYIYEAAAYQNALWRAIIMRMP